VNSAKFLKIIVLASICFSQIFGVNKFIGRKFRHLGSCIHGGFEGVFKPIYSPDERFTANINPKDGLRIVNNDSQEAVLKIDTVEINDFGFSSDNRYFFVDYRSCQKLKASHGSSIDIFDLCTFQRILTIPQYSLFSTTRRRKFESCDYNDFVRFECKNNIFTICQKSKENLKIAEMYGVSLVKYCSGSECFACFLKSGVLKIFEMDNFEVKELFTFLPYSYQNPGRSFYKP